MPLNNNIMQVQDYCAQVGSELTRRYYEACEASRNHIRNEEHNHAIKMLYTNGALTKLATIEATPENANHIHNIFKLMKKFKEHKGAPNETTIEDEGAKLGFNEEESLCIYNMVCIEAALKNLNSQKGAASDFILERI